MDYTEVNVRRLARRGRLLLGLLLCWPMFAAGAGDHQRAAHHEAIATLLNQAAQEVDAGKFDAASSTVERALRIDPDDASLWRLLAQVRQRQGREAQARTLYAKADAIDEHSSTEVAKYSTTSQPAVVVAATQDAHAARNAPPSRDVAWARSRAELARAIAAYQSANSDVAQLREAVLSQEDRIDELASRLRQAQRERERLLGSLYDREASQHDERYGRASRRGSTVFERPRGRRFYRHTH